MNCEDCQNYKRHDRFAENSEIVVQTCQNFKPKQHPLDKLQELITNGIFPQIDNTGSVDVGKLNENLQKLRYESIKWWITEVNGWQQGKELLDRELKNTGHEDWIVK